MKTIYLVPPTWRSFSVAKSTCNDIAAAWLVNKVASASVSPFSTHRRCVETICSSSAIPIVSICDALDGKAVGPKGNTYFGAASDEIDSILGNYEDISWWVSEQGLHIGIIEPENRVGSLKPFDGFAGPLVLAVWDDKLPQANTKISKSALADIAAKLDDSCLLLKDSLQPAQREKLAKHNRKYNKKPITTFTAAINDPRFVQMVRRRLYRARDSYDAALEVVKPTAQKIPKCFWSLYDL
jgi:hypothetical protein